MSCGDKIVYQCAEAPAAIGPYSVAAGAGNFVYTAGQIPVDPGTGEIVPGGIEEQTRQVLTNLDKVLRSAGSCLENALKTTVYLSDMQNFAAMNRIYGEFFSENPPARTTIAAAGLPKKALVEIDVIAVVCADRKC